MNRVLALAMDGKSDGEIMTILGMSGTEFEVWKDSHPLAGLLFATVWAKCRRHLAPTDRPSPEIMQEMLHAADGKPEGLLDIFGVTKYMLRIWKRQFPTLRDVLRNFL